METSEKYCPIRGKPVTDSTYQRFGEFCCSEGHAEGHAEEFVKEVRALKVQAAQSRPPVPAGGEEARSAGWFGRRRGCC